MMATRAPGGLRANLLKWEVYGLLFLLGLQKLVGGTLGWFLIRPVNWALSYFFRAFNWVFEQVTQVYGKTVGWGLRLSVIVLVVYVGLIGLTGSRLHPASPSGFIPNQDKGYLLANINGCPIPPSLAARSR